MVFRGKGAGDQLLTECKEGVSEWGEGGGRGEGGGGRGDCTNITEP